MKLTAKKYKFTSKDRESLKLLGYKIVGQNNPGLEEFMQNKFPNFNLLILLEVVEAAFSHTTTSHINRRIEFDNTSSVLKIDYQNVYKDEDDAAMFIREFAVMGKTIQIKHEYCVLPELFRGQNLIKPVFQESLRQYVNMNAKKILVHAGLSGGGYTWAKHGFVAIDKSEVEQILNKANRMIPKPDYAIVKKIYDIYYTKNPTGKSFPMDLWSALDYMKEVLMGSDWHGELDLKDQNQFRNFNDYVFR
jgi:hypothetical protein